MRYFVVAYRGTKVAEMGSFKSRDKARAYATSLKALGFTTKTVDRAAG